MEQVKGKLVYQDNEFYAFVSEDMDPTSSDEDFFEYHFGISGEMEDYELIDDDGTAWSVEEGTISITSAKHNSDFV